MNINDIKNMQFEYAEETIGRILEKYGLSRDQVLGEIGDPSNYDLVRKFKSYFPDIGDASAGGRGGLSFFGLQSLSAAINMLEGAYKLREHDAAALLILQEAVFFAGAAFGCSYGGDISDALDVVRKSKIGKKGAKKKHGATNELKKWALAEVKKIKSGDKGDKDVSRLLVRRIPEHLMDVSKDPESLIYKALLARHKVKK